MKMRMEGYSIRDIAEKLDCSHQTVASYIHQVCDAEPTPDSGEVPYHNLSEKEVTALAKAIERNNGKISGVCRDADLDEDTVRRCYAYILAHRPGLCRGKMYPNVHAWMKKRMYTLTRMSKELGISKHIITNVLRGYTHMPLAFAERLKSLTGLSLREIYSEHIPIIEEEIEKDRSVAMANEWAMGVLKTSTSKANGGGIDLGRLRFAPVKPKEPIIMPPPKRT